MQRNTTVLVALSIFLSVFASLIVIGIVAFATSTSSSPSTGSQTPNNNNNNNNPNANTFTSAPKGWNQDTYDKDDEDNGLDGRYGCDACGCFGDGDGPVFADSGCRGTPDCGKDNLVACDPDEPVPRVNFKTEDVPIAKLGDDDMHHLGHPDRPKHNVDRMRVVRNQDDNGAVVGVVYYNEKIMKEKFPNKVSRHEELMKRLYLGFRDKQLFRTVYNTYPRVYLVDERLWMEACGVANFGQTFTSIDMSKCGNGHHCIALHELGHHFEGSIIQSDVNEKGRLEAAMAKSLGAAKERWAPYAPNFREYCADMFNYWFNREKRARLRKFDCAMYDYLKKHFYKIEAEKVSRTDREPTFL